MYTHLRTYALILFFRNLVINAHLILYPRDDMYTLMKDLIDLRIPSDRFDYLWIAVLDYIDILILRGPSLQLNSIAGFDCVVDCELCADKLSDFGDPLY